MFQLLLCMTTVVSGVRASNAFFDSLRLLLLHAPRSGSYYHMIQASVEVRSTAPPDILGSQQEATTKVRYDIGWFTLDSPSCS